MKTTLFSGVISVILLTGLNASAGTLDCSSADQKLSFHTDSPDGGAPRPPVTKLKLDQQVLIDISFLDQTNIALATYQFSASERVIATRKNGSYRTQLLVKKIAVIQSEKILFNDYVFCSATTYVGPPMP